MKIMLCTICLLLLSGCTAPTVHETWKGFRVAANCPADVLKPKMPRPRPAEMQQLQAISYRIQYWPQGGLYERIMYSGRR